MSTTLVEDVRNPDVKHEIDEPMTKKISDSSLGFEADEYISKFLELSNEAKDGESKEKSMTLMEGIRTYPKAAMWSVILSSALIMEGYDTSLLSSLFGFPAFAKKYGEWDATANTFVVSPHWQTIIQMCTNVGEIVGLYFAGIVADRIGYRYTLISALFLTACFIFIAFFATNIKMLVAAEFLLGLPWGAFQTLTTTYASEVCPLVLRVYLTTYVNMCWVFGQLISSGILKGLEGNSQEYAYKIPFAVQWVWPIPIAIGIYLAPESPWWLVRKGKQDQAKRSLNRLMSENSSVPDKSAVVDIMVKKMDMTIQAERAEIKHTSYLDCFKGVNFRRTRVAALVWVIQNWSGSAIMGYSTVFYEQAGLSSSNAFTFTIIQYALGICGVITSWFLSQKLGRFDIFFGGLVLQFIILILIGGLGCASSTGAEWGIGTLLLIFTYVYDSSVGPVCYCMVTEIPSTLLRAKSVAIARNLYNIAGIFNGLTTSYMVNAKSSGGWGWKAKTGFFWAGITLIDIVWCWFELPETKDKTFAELDALFENHSKARDFKNAEIDAFDAGRMMEEFGHEGIKNIVEKEEHFISEENVGS